MTTHLADINSGVVTRRNVIGIRKLMNTWLRVSHGYSVSSTSPKVSSETVAAIARALSDKEPVVIGELRESGLKVLRNPRYRKRLAAHAAIIASIDQFCLVRFDQIGHYSLGVVPVYRACSRNGSFLFRNIPWQSHGNGPEILDEVV